MSFLGPYFRLGIKNNSSVTSGTSTVKGKRWKPGTSGEYLPETTEQTFFSGTIISGSYSFGTGLDNSTLGYYGSSLSVSLNNLDTAAGDFEVWLQQSTDGGITWPANGEGILLGIFNVAASTTEVVNISF